MKNSQKIRQEQRDFDARFQEQAIEILFLANNGSNAGGSKKGGEVLWTASRHSIAYVDEQGSLQTRIARLEWLIPSTNAADRRFFFQAQSAYRVLVRPAIHDPIPTQRHFMLLEILQENAQHPALQAALTRYQTPVFLNIGDDTLTLNRDYDSFDGSVHWQGKPISLSLDTDAPMAKLPCKPLTYSNN